MTHVTFIEHDGTSHQLEAEDGASLMQLALDNLVPGIIGHCGGTCACATCHCYIDPEHLSRLTAPSVDEAQILDGLYNPQPGSRLSCQIQVTPEMEGLVVHLPESQLA
jgi:2Fe-2S ferredoxin